MNFTTTGRYLAMVLKDRRSNEFHRKFCGYHIGPFAKSSPEVSSNNESKKSKNTIEDL